MGVGALSELTEAVEDSVVLMFGRSLHLEVAVISSHSPLEALPPNPQEVVCS